MTATTSPLLYRNFGASLSPPSHPNPPIKCSPVGAAPALRQKVEQSVVEDNKEIDVPAGIGGSSPQFPTPLAVATAAFSLPIASATLEKKCSDEPPPLVVMNLTPPPHLHIPQRHATTRDDQRPVNSNAHCNADICHPTYTLARHAGSLQVLTCSRTGGLLQVWLLKYFASLLAFFSA